MDRGERHAGPEEVFACRFPEGNSCGGSVWYDLGAGLFWGGGTEQGHDASERPRLRGGNAET